MDNVRFIEDFLRDRKASWNHRLGRGDRHCGNCSTFVRCTPILGFCSVGKFYTSKMHECDKWREMWM